MMQLPAPPEHLPRKAVPRTQSVETGRGQQSTIQTGSKTWQNCPRGIGYKDIMDARLWSHGAPLQSSREGRARQCAAASEPLKGGPVQTGSSRISGSLPRPDPSIWELEYLFCAIKCWKSVICFYFIGAHS